MIKALLFDFDGTIADTAPGIILTFQETFKTLNLAVPSAEAIRNTIGVPLWDSVKNLGGLDDEVTQRGVDLYRSIFPTHEVTHITLFPNVVETINELSDRGFRMAICTSRGINSLERILSRFGLWDRFETVVTASDNLPSKPAPDMVLTLLERMGINADEAIVIGDTTYDIGMGSSAGCKTVAVTYGNHSPAQLRSAEPSFFIDDFAAIEDVLNDLEG